jgi:hypothetical protein
LDLVHKTKSAGQPDWVGQYDVSTTVYTGFLSTSHSFRSLLEGEASFVCQSWYVFMAAEPCLNISIRSSVFTPKCKTLYILTYVQLTSSYIANI